MNYKRIIFLSFVIFFPIIRGIFGFYANYEYKDKIGCYWDLAQRSSEISQRKEYIDKFIFELEKCHLDNIHNALFSPNNENDFTYNFNALKSLRNQLKDISYMTKGSLEYEIAFLQITLQDQGKEYEFVKNIYCCWEKKYHYTYWNNIIVYSFLTIQILSLFFWRRFKK